MYAIHDMSSTFHTYRWIKILMKLSWQSQRIIHTWVWCLVMGGTSLEVYLIIECCVLEAEGASSSFTGLIAAFNMTYPEALYAAFIFIQHFLLIIQEKQPLPISLTKLLSSLDKIPGVWLNSYLFTYMHAFATESHYSHINVSPSVI